MPKSTKAKREKQKQKRLAEAQADAVSYDVIQLLEEADFSTKPTTAKFLNTYVKSIKASISNGKVQFYPTLKYSLSKVFVKFLDGHELVYQLDTSAPGAKKFSMYCGIDEVGLDCRQQQLVAELFDAVMKFKFVVQSM